MFGSAKYRNYEYGADDHVAIVHTEHLAKYAAIFVTTACHTSACKGQFDYSRNFYASDADELIIQLPITDTGSIDYTFMENFISELELKHLSELELKHLSELELYFQTTGLSTYALNNEENAALQMLDEIQWEEFSYSYIFDNIKQGRRLKKNDQLTGNIPFVMAGTTNTGIANYISNPVASFPHNSITIDIFGNSFYRNYDFGAGDDTGVYWSNSKNYSQKVMLFFTAIISKSLLGKFSYGKKLRSSQTENMKCLLPITAQGEPDYNFMELYIKAIEKLVIKDVVLYADKKIAATKKAINSNNSKERQ